MSISSLLNTSKDTLLSYQLALDVTSSNIANVNTPGYSRQRPVFVSVGTADVGSKSAQVGVDVSNIARIYDEYLNNQVVYQSQVLGYSQAKSDALDRLEGIFAENGGGASDLMNKFWNAWSELAANPKGQVERENLLAASDEMTAAFRRLDGDLTKIVQDAGDNISNIISQINNYISQIAELNKEIAGIASDKGEANLPKDKRSDLLNKLGNLIVIDYTEDAKGAVDVFLADGRPLVTGDHVWELAGKTNAANIVDDIVYLNNPTVSLKSGIASSERGQLSSLLEIGDTIVPGYRGKLDAVVNAIIAEVNLQHGQGYDNYGRAGGDFFDSAQTNAKNFRVSAAIAADVNKIAASATVNGDGDNARLIDAIKDKAILNGATATVNNYYASFIGQIGRDVAGAKSDLEQQTSIMQQISNRQEAVSGVSIDEEMMDLMKYQLAYSAAGKLVNTVNEMLTTLIDLGK